MRPAHQRTVKQHGAKPQALNPANTFDLVRSSERFVGEDEILVEFLEVCNIPGGWGSFG